MSKTSAKNPRARGKPPNDFYTSLQKKPLRADWNMLVSACLEAILNNELDIIVAFSFVTKLPRGFPAGILEEKSETSNIHRIKARKLLKWLRDRGYTTITDEQIEFEKRRAAWVDRRLNLEGALFGTIEEEKLD